MSMEKNILDGLYVCTTRKDGDDLGMVYDIAFTTLFLDGFLPWTVAISYP